MQTEIVDIHSLDHQGSQWALCVYQTPSVLKVADSAIAEKLKTALDEGCSVVLTWEPESGLVARCQLCT